jgi:hypothetical protein
MSWESFRSTILTAVFASTFFAATAHAEPLLNEVHTVALTGAVVPAEHPFTLSSTDDVTLTLTDFGATGPTPVPLKSVKLAVTKGATIVATLDAPGDVTFAGSSGDFVVHIVGELGAPGSGSIAVHIADPRTNTVFDFSDSLSAPIGAIPAEGSGVDDLLTVPASGNYTITLNDMQLPQPLKVLSLAIVTEGGSLVTKLDKTTSLTVTAALQSGVNYRIFAVGNMGIDPDNPDPGILNAGLFGVNVTPEGGTTPTYTRTVPVGQVILVGSPALTAGSYTLTASDLQLPGALQQFGVVATNNGQSAASLSTTGSQTFTATPGTYQIFGLGVVPAGGTGSYAIGLQSGQTTVLSVARAVVDKASNLSAYSFDTSSLTAQSYTFDIADFGYPAAFAKLDTAVIQAGTLVTGSQVSIGTSVANTPATGTVNFTPAAGPATILVFAQPAASTNTTNAAGLFGIDMTAAGASVFETTQGVGQLFSVRKVSITAAGNYQITLGDSEFPVKFQALAAIVTHGTSKIGSAFGGGTFGFAAQPGDYEVSFLAQPSNDPKTGVYGAGTYSMVVDTAPPPTLDTFSANPASVASGSTTVLTWSGSNITSCTASNGWTGSKKATDSFTTGALTATTIFTLTCDGPGGSVAKSVTVVVNSISSPSKGGGGGGAIRPDLLVALAGLLLFRRRMFSC